MSVSDIYDRERDLIEQFSQKANSNREAFRNEARSYLKDLTPYKRKFIKSLRSKDTQPYDILTAWRDEIVPSIDSLNQSRQSKVFYKSVAKHLYVSDSMSQMTVDDIVQHQIDRVEEEFVQQFDRRSVRYAVRRMLRMPTQEVEAIRSQYIMAKLASKVASESNIQLVDPHSSALNKLLARAAVRRERRRSLRSDARRLKQIARRLHEIQLIDSGIVGDIIRQEIDLMSVLAARASYEKRLSNMSKDDAMDVATLQEIFYDETSQIRRKAIAKISGSSEMGLESIQDRTLATEQLIRRIFDLPITRKNKLLVLTKEHRELRQEHDDILRAQKNRLDEKA